MSARFTVVVTTRDRPAGAARAVASLTAQKFRPHEILVVDNGSSERVRLALKARIKGAARLIVEPRPGLSAARNRAVDEAGGDFIAFLDDDAHAHPNWLDSLARCLEETGALACGGPTIARWEREPPRRILRSPKAQSYLGIFSLGQCRRPLAGFHDFLIGTNCVYRREVFRGGEGFLDIPWGRPTGGGDLEFSRRVMRRGPVWYEPGAVVYHRIPARKWSWPALAATAFDYGMKKAFIERPLSPRGAADWVGVDGYISAFSFLGYAVGSARVVVGKRR